MYSSCKVNLQRAYWSLLCTVWYGMPGDSQRVWCGIFKHYFWYFFLNFVCKFSSNVHIIPFSEGKQLCGYTEAAVIPTSVFYINAHNVDAEDLLELPALLAIKVYRTDADYCMKKRNNNFFKSVSRTGKCKSAFGMALQRFVILMPCITLQSSYTQYIKWTTGV